MPLAEGLALGGISAVFEAGVYPGIAARAVPCTFSVLAVMLILRTGRASVRPTERFRTGVRGHRWA